MERREAPQLLFLLRLSNYPPPDFTVGCGCQLKGEGLFNPNLSLIIKEQMVRSPDGGEDQETQFPS